MFNPASVVVTDLSDSLAIGTSAVFNSSTTFTINSVAGSTFGGVMSGTGKLATIARNVQTLTGLNTYTGATLVSGGTLNLDLSINNNVLPGTNGVTL